MISITCKTKSSAFSLLLYIYFAKMMLCQTGTYIKFVEYFDMSHKVWNVQWRPKAKLNLSLNRNTRLKNLWWQILLKIYTLLYKFLCKIIRYISASFYLLKTIFEKGQKRLTNKQTKNKKRNKKRVKKISCSIELYSFNMNDQSESRLMVFVYFL